MDRTQFENIKQADVFPTTLSVAEVGSHERTLAYGWNLDTTGGGTMHVYVKDGLIHSFLYKTHQVSSGVYATSNIRHISAEVMDVEDLRPTKRAYPERTDAHFAMLMKQRDAALSLTSFDDERYEESKNNAFHGEIFTGREAFL
jgi:hypothetical protein